MPYFDAYLVAPQQPAETPPPQLTGAILYGPGAAEQRRVCSTWHAGGLWHDAGTLDCLVGPGDPRFPAGAPLVVDLQLPSGELPRCLKKPAADWWPLANGLAGSRQFLRLNLPPGAATAAGVRKLAQRFPRTRFVLDPFRHGPAPGWQAQVRLAECPNVWLTTLGLLPGGACRWPRAEEVAEAFYFTTGEVGASRLVLASGWRWEDLLSLALAPQWLARVECLDDAERELIMETNAGDVFGR